MNDRVDTIGGGGDPRDHHSEEEEHGDFCVGPDCGVGFHSCVLASRIEVGTSEIGMSRRGNVSRSG